MGVSEIQGPHIGSGRGGHSGLATTLKSEVCLSALPLMMDGWSFLRPVAKEIAELQNSEMGRKLGPGVSTAAFVRSNAVSGPCFLAGCFPPYAPPNKLQLYLQAVDG